MYGMSCVYQVCNVHGKYVQNVTTNVTTTAAPDAATNVTTTAAAEAATDAAAQEQTPKRGLVGRGVRVRPRIQRRPSDRGTL